MNKKFSGIIVPAITPLNSKFEIDIDAVERIFNNFYDHQISPFILGTTGESSSLSIQQKKNYVKTAADSKKSGTILYAGISSNIVSESVEFAKFCADNKVDVVAATLPSYYALTEIQMKKYFLQLADAIPIPLVIYNIPATTHMSIPLQIIDELSHHPNIIATKDSERSDERLQQSLELWKARKDFGYFLGWAAKSVEALLGGSDGLIPSTGNIKPVIYEKMWMAAREGNIREAQQMQYWSDEYGKIYQNEKTLGESLWALKALMKKKGLCDDYVMPPLQAMDSNEAIELASKYVDLENLSQLT